MGKFVPPGYLIDLEHPLKSVRIQPEALDILIIVVHQKATLRMQTPLFNIGFIDKFLPNSC